MAAQTDEVAALRRRIEELERAVAEHESGAFYTESDVAPGTTPDDLRHGGSLVPSP